MSADAPPLLRWQGGRLVGVEDKAPQPDERDATELIVADSFLVNDGLALALDVHRERFLRTAGDAEAVGEAVAADAAAFWKAAIDALPRGGSWFPRIEALRSSDAVHLQLRTRPAPALGRSVRVRALDEDPRRTPLVKGPDLPRLIRLSAAARERGIDECVVLSPDGVVVEGITTSLMWWRGDAIVLPDAELPRVDSVTARVVETVAAARGIPVLRERVAPEALDGLEVWALNALHGARIVREWVDGPSLAELPGRLEEWRRMLRGLRRRIPGSRPGHPV